MGRNVFDRGEFMDFMDGFLKEHPEVVKDQKHGWDIYWNPKKADLEEPGFARMGSPAKRESAPSNEAHAPF